MTKITKNIKSKYVELCNDILFKTQFTFKIDKITSMATCPIHILSNISLAHSNISYPDASAYLLSINRRKLMLHSQLLRNTYLQFEF